MPRLFTAIEIPEPVALQLSLLRGGLPGARWIDPENYHLTLRFIGDIDTHTARDIARDLARTRREGFSVRLSGLDAFGNRKPHSIFARIERSEALDRLQAEHERIARRNGCKPDTRKFVPHVTLARLRSVKPGDVASYLALRGSFSAPAFEATRFVLYSSRDSVGGGPYRIEDAYDLEPVSSAPDASDVTAAAFS